MPWSGHEVRVLALPGCARVVSTVATSSPRAVAERSSIRMRSVAKRSSASRMNVNRSATDGISSRSAASSGRAGPMAGTGREPARSQARVADMARIVSGAPGRGQRVVGSAGSAREGVPWRYGPVRAPVQGPRRPAQPPPAPPPSPGSVIFAGSRSSSSRSGAMPFSSAISRIVRPLLKPSLAIAAAAS